MMGSPIPPTPSLANIAVAWMECDATIARMLDDPTLGRLVPVHLGGRPCAEIDVYPDADPIFPESLSGGFDIARRYCSAPVTGWVLTTCATGNYNDADAWVGLPVSHRRRRLAPVGDLRPVVLIFSPFGLTLRPAVVWRIGLGGPTPGVDPIEGEVLSDNSIRWCGHHVPPDLVPPALRVAASEARRP